MRLDWLFWPCLAESYEMWQMEGSVSYFDEEQGKIYYDIDTGKGQSGSRVYYRENEEYFVCEVHVRGSQNGNFAILITRCRYEQIYQWIEKDGKKELRLFLEKTGYLGLGSHNIDTEWTSALLKYNLDGLQMLSFLSNTINTDGIKMVAQNLSWVSLTQFSLSPNWIEDEELQAPATNSLWRNLSRLYSTRN